jgi:hypothetical protein
MSMQALPNPELWSDLTGFWLGLVKEQMMIDY